MTAAIGTVDARDALFLRFPVLVRIESKDNSVKVSANLIMKEAKITQNEMAQFPLLWPCSYPVSQREIVHGISSEFLFMSR